MNAYISGHTYHGKCICVGFATCLVICFPADGLQHAFRSFGAMKIEWPGKEGKHPRYPPKGQTLLIMAKKMIKPLVLVLFSVMTLVSLLDF